MGMTSREIRDFARRQAKEASRLRRVSVSDGSAAVLKASHRLFEMGRVAQAKPGLRRAVGAFPDDVALGAAYAYALAATGDTEPAIKQYRQLLQREPSSAPLMTNLAVLLIKSDDSDAAEELLMRARELAPEHTNTAYMLGELLSSQGKGEQAHREFSRAIALYKKQIRPNAGPESADHLVKLAAAQMWMGQIQPALANFDRAVRVRPNHALALARRGLALAQLRRFPEAVASLKQSAAVEPSFFEAKRALGDVLLAAGDTASARKNYRKALRLKPDDALTKYFLASTEDQGSPDAPPPDYVIKLFNDYAQKFDEHLVETLKYRVPELLVDTLRDTAKPSAADWTVVDLGCGTGLCGPLIRPYARRLVGVDISPGMLEKADAKGAYDELIQSDIVVALDHIDYQVDAFISADVLVYLGNLTNVFAGVARTLRPGGWFAFTTEKFDGENFRLSTTGRYLHSGAYIEVLAKEHGFDIGHAETVVGRYQTGKPVEHHLHVLRLTDST